MNHVNYKIIKFRVYKIMVNKLLTIKIYLKFQKNEYFNLHNKEINL